MAKVKIDSKVLPKMEDLHMGTYFVHDGNLCLMLPLHDDRVYNCYNFNGGHYEYIDWDEDVVIISSDLINITVG